MSASLSPARARRENRVAVLSEPGIVRLETRPMPIPDIGEVLVEVSVTGVCGSDVHYYRHGRIGDWVVKAPLVLGHECAGVVIETGPGATRHRIGERVAVEPGRACGRCSQCREGGYNLCSAVRFLATPPVDGAFARYIAVHEDYVHPLPDGVGDVSGALIEPFSVGLWAVGRAGIRPGARVVITGAGPIGLCGLLAARTSGAAEVVVVDPVAARRQRALALGATTVASPDEDLASVARDADAFLECSGSADALADGLRALRPRGTAVVVGMSGEASIPVPIALLQARELTLAGSFRYAHTYRAAIALVAGGRVDLESLVDARFSLEQTEEALQIASTDPTVIKAIVLPNESRPLSPSRPRVLTTWRS